MRMTPHEVKTPATWTKSAYGEPTVTYNTETNVPMFIGWITAMRGEVEGAIYEQYEFVALTRANVSVGALIDGKYIVGHVEKGRINRLFMNYAEGADRTYVEQQGNTE